MGADLSFSTLRQVDAARDANFQNASLRGANLVDVQMLGAVNFRGVCFKSAVLRNVQLDGAHFDRRSGFEGASLEGILSFRHAQMEALQLDKAFLRPKSGSGPDFSGAKLRQASLRNLQMASALFTEADLSQVRPLHTPPLPRPYPLELAALTNP